MEKEELEGRLLAGEARSSLAQAGEPHKGADGVVPSLRL